MNRKKILLYLLPLFLMTVGAAHATSIDADYTLLLQGDKAYKMYSASNRTEITDLDATFGGALTVAGNATEGYAWTMNNLTFTSSCRYAMKVERVDVNATDEEFRLIVKGDNNLTGGSVKAYSTAGLMLDSLHANISGTGLLNCVAGNNIDNTYTGSCSFGICAEGALTIDSTAVSAIGGYVEGQTYGTTKASQYPRSMGIYVHDDLLIRNAEVNANAKIAMLLSLGAFSETGSIRLEGDSASLKAISLAVTQPGYGYSAAVVMSKLSDIYVRDASENLLIPQRKPYVSGINVFFYLQNGSTKDFATNVTVSAPPACTVIDTFPWTEGFESFPLGIKYSPAPNCWATLNAKEGNFPYLYIHNSVDYVHSGSKSLFFTSDTEKYCYAIMPEISNYRGKELTFSYKHERVDRSGRLFVGYMTDITDESTFVQLSEQERSASWVTCDPIALSSVPADARIAFKYGGSPYTAYYFGIDDIVITSVPVICINYDMRGHGEAIPNDTILSGNRPTRPEDPVAEGFEFRDWYIDSLYTKAFNFYPILTASQDSTITLYAKWRDPVAWEQFLQDLNTYSYVEFDTTYTYGIKIHLATTADAVMEQAIPESDIVEVSAAVKQEYNTQHLSFVYSRLFLAVADELAGCLGLGEKAPEREPKKGKRAYEDNILADYLKGFVPLPYRQYGIEAVLNASAVPADMVYQSWSQTNYDTETDVCQCMFQSDAFFKAVATIREIWRDSEK